MITRKLAELQQKHPRYYEQLQENIYVLPAAPVLGGYYVMEEVKPGESVILEICRNEQEAQRERERQIVNYLDRFDERHEPLPHASPRRWKATATICRLPHPLR
jgi:hypothetical protein